MMESGLFRGARYPAAQQRVLLRQLAYLAGYGTLGVEFSPYPPNLVYF